MQIYTYIYIILVILVVRIVITHVFSKGVQASPVQHWGGGLNVSQEGIGFSTILGPLRGLEVGSK